MSTFFRTDSDDSTFTARRNSELNPSPLSQPEEEEEKPSGSTVFESQIDFTMDIIDPWSFIAKKRLDIALERFRASPSAKEVNFTVRFLPYQLYPDFSKTGEDKYEWYKREKFNNSEKEMKKFTTEISAYGAEVDIDFNFNGIIAKIFTHLLITTISDTLEAHRLLQHYQENSPPSSNSASLLLTNLYTLHHTHAQHPSSPPTLLAAATAAGIEQASAEAVVGDRFDSLIETNMLMEEAWGAVAPGIGERGNLGGGELPVVEVEGRGKGGNVRLVGCKGVEEYWRVLEGVGRGV